MDNADVRQGALGDCYFLSAIAVLGSAQTREKFIFIDGPDEWYECGAFCVKFYDGGKENIVIIDDAFLRLYDDMAFVKTPSKKELWPCILEKAFAKKYGSFSIIDGGLVDIALAELTNGIPETFMLEEQKNVQALWTKTLALYKEGNFLGAGSPSHP